MKHIILWIFVLIALPLASQKPVWEWAITTGGPGKSWFNGSRISPDGHIFLTGGYNAGYVTFGSDTLLPCSSQWADIFLAKLTPAGSVVWIKTFCGFGQESGNKLAFDKLGNLYVTGIFSSPYLVFGSDTLLNLAGASTPTYGYQFIVKLDSAGNYLWGKVIGGLRIQGYGVDVAVDNENNLLVMGFFLTPNVVFGNDTLINYGNQNIFLAKYTSNGNLLWSRSAGGTVSDCPFSIDVDETGHVLLTGLFSSIPAWFDTIVLFNPVTIGAGNKYCFFLAKYSPAGQVVWVKAEGGPGMSEGREVAAYPSGGSLVAGTVYPPSGLFGNTVVTPAGDACAVFTRHDDSGNLLWANAVGGTVSTSKELGYSITTDIDGAVIASGMFFSPTLTIGNDTLYNPINGVVYESNIFIVKYNPAGSPLWSVNLGGTGNDFVNDLCTDFTNGVYVTGYFGSTILIIGNDTLVNNQQLKGYVAKLSETTDITDPKIELSEIRVYPNPFTEQVLVVLPKGLPEVVWELYDLHGRLLLHGKLRETNPIFLHDLPKGVYVLSLANHEAVMTRKLLKTR
jgi:hypothetical protein